MKRCGDQGFNLVELMVVVAFFTVLAGIALPSLLSTIYVSRIRWAATDVAGLMQNARIMAERKNQVLGVFAGSVETNATGVYINCNPTACPDSSGNWQTGDPDIPYAATISNGAAANAPTTLSPGFTTQSAGSTLYFNARGIVSTSTGTMTSGVIYYLTDTHGDWAAISVATAGRSRAWVWNGTTWQ